jgi:hypothetical protein
MRDGYGSRLKAQRHLKPRRSRGGVRTDFAGGRDQRKNKMTTMVS